MAIQLFVARERAEGEKRVALVPEVAGKLVKAGFSVAIEKGAGEAANYPDGLYESAGAGLAGGDAVSTAQIVLRVGPPTEDEIAAMPEGSMLVCFMTPHKYPARVAALRDRRITTFAMELVPRVTRAQSMDALSSQATVAGYKAALLAASLSGRFFPMLTTAAGTVRPARALILGAGVAGLQAIATAKRLGAIVEAYDVRRATKEQVESLGARFIAAGNDAEGSGGYARELTEEEKARERELLAKHISQADVVITTAQIPGRPSPKLISARMVDAMKPGAVIVDLAAEGGGNCELTKPGETINHGAVTIAGPLNIISTLAVHASEMYAKNIYNLLMLITKEGKSLDPDWGDEIIAGSVLTVGGEIKHELTRVLIEGGSK